MSDVSDSIFMGGKPLNSNVGKIPALKDQVKEILLLPFDSEGAAYRGYSRIDSQELIELLNKQAIKKQTPINQYAVDEFILSFSWAGDLYITRIDFSMDVADATTIQILNTDAAVIWCCFDFTSKQGHYEFNPPLHFPVGNGIGHAWKLYFIWNPSGHKEIRIQGFTEE